MRKSTLKAYKKANRDFLKPLNTSTKVFNNKKKEVKPFKYPSKEK